MTPSEWQHVRDLFEAAIEQPPSDVRAWLAAHATDERIRAEVLSLVEHERRAGAFLVDSVVERLPDLLADDTPLDAGDRVGAYLVIREIGRGGMGRVYLARDERLGRDVALKALAPQLTHDVRQRERLRREARAAAALAHPGICTVYALEERDDALFIASEYVDGRTLRDEIQSGRRPAPDAALAAARDLASALGAAHAKGITHRDLKPENVMRAADGRWKILDFGLARIDRPDATDLAGGATSPGAVLGTPAYMAPEQLNGAPAGPASDVFALGVLLYEWIAGEHPFAAATPLAVVARVLESEARPLAERVPHLPLPLASAIDRALSKRVDRRFDSAEGFLAALDEAPLRPSGGPSLTWWRTHQVVVMVAYIAATTAAWHVKEHLVSGAGPVWIFVSLGVGSALGGIMRGHLLFTERMNRPRIRAERRRTARAIVGVDLLLAAALFADGLLVAPVRPLWAVFVLALAMGIALAGLLMEPATTAAAFGEEES